MLLLITRYWTQLVAAVAALALGVWLTSGYYGSKVDRLTVEVAEARAQVAVQSSAVAALEADAAAARERAQEALAEQRRASERHARTVEQLRRDLRDRTHKDERCEDAASSALQQWRSR